MLVQPPRRLLEFFFKFCFIVYVFFLCVLKVSLVVCAGQGYLAKGIDFFSSYPAHKAGYVVHFGISSPLC